MKSKMWKSLNRKEKNQFEEEMLKPVVGGQFVINSLLATLWNPIESPIKEATNITIPSSREVDLEMTSLYNTPMTTTHIKVKASNANNTRHKGFLFIFSNVFNFNVKIELIMPPTTKARVTRVRHRTPLLEENDEQATTTFPVIDEVNTACNFK